MRIESIETHYNGYRFRSRLEARYAIFFDALGIRYWYEHEGFKIGKTYYLPDFYLPDLNCYFEVKGVMTPEDEDKIIKLASVVARRGQKVFIGNPDFGEYMLDSPIFEDKKGWLIDSGIIDYAYIVKCENCNNVSFVDARGQNGLECQERGMIKCPICKHAFCPDGNYYGTDESDNPIFAQRINSAILKAKQARFEHGETP